MRAKIIGQLIENVNTNKTNYNHEMYSMILANIDTKRASKLHAKTKFKRLFTFTNLYIKNNMAHFYISGEDDFIKDFINGIMRSQLIKIGDKVLNITSIQDISSEIKEKEEYYLKTRFIVNEMENGKVCLSKNKEYIQKRIFEIIKSKYEEIYSTEINEEIKVNLITMNKKFTKYKNHHINSYESVIKIQGSNRLVNLLYNVGIGENTATGHGFVWEV